MFVKSTSMIKYIYKPKNCPPNNVLYRITFKYKTNFSGNKLFNLTRKNFPDFVVDIPNRQLRPGDSVRYTPLNKNNPNHGKLAMITSENNRRIYGKIVKTFDLEFISPTVRGNKVINNVRLIPQDKNGSTILTLIPQVSMYRCSSPFVPMSLINGYLTAYKNYNSKQTNRRLRVLERQGIALFDKYFHLGNNNEPLYPEFVSRGQPGVFDLQKRMKTKMNKEVEKMVNNSFLSGSKTNKPIIKGKGKRKTLEFAVPKDARGGKLVAINVDGIDINIRVPIGSKSLDRITVPIERSNNEAVYERLKPSSKKESHLTFIPTFITAKFSNDKHLDIHKLVKASKNQSFKIKDASIIKQNNGANFKFMELARFNKTNNPLVFDLEVHVDLKLEVSKSSKADSGGVDSGGTTNKIFSGIGNMIQNSGSGCPSKMRKLKQSMKNVSSQIEKSRSTPGERGNRTKRRRRDERKRGRKTFNTKRKKIKRNRTRGKKRKYSVKKIFKTRTGYKKKRRSVRI